MTYLDRVPQPELRVGGLGEGPILRHPLIMVTGDLRGRAGGSRQIGEECVHPGRVEAQVGW